MKQFKQLIKELPSKKVVFAFGRFQPPTTGHELLVNAVKKIASAQKADHIIFASRTQDKKSNPLPVDRKVYYLKRMFPNTNFIAANEEIRTFMEAAKALSKKYKNLVMIAGSDRVPEYKKLLDRYNGDVFHFDTVEVVSAGERDPDADTASGMSGTKMREAAKKNDFALFKKGLPHTLTELDGKRLMNEIRQGMGMDVVKEQVKFETDDIREKYFSGDIFHVGDIVESDGVVYQIVKRGSNHLLVEDEQGNKISKWPQDLQESTKEFKGLNEMLIKSADKLKVARIIASSLGMEDVDEKTGAEQMVNVSLRKIKSKNLTPEAWKILGNMLKLASDAGIKYDSSIIPETKFKVMGLEEEKESEEYAEMEDNDIDEMINGLTDDDYLEAYDDEELSIVDDETGECIAELKEEVINEVLSRAERIRAKIRFARSEAKRERKTKIALKTRSNTATLNTRARRLAIATMKKRLAKKPLDKLSVAEKERLEATIAKRKKIIDRIAMRLVPRVKKIENDRLSHKKYTK
jgi:nicotinamide mononucleotide adenylyltransferase